MTRTARRRRATSLLYALAVVAGGLASCASLPPASAPRVAKAPAAYETARSFEAQARDWPTDDWWRRYNDPRLNALMDEALKSSPTLAEATARLARARADRSVAAAAVLPSLDVTGSVKEDKESYKSAIPAIFIPQGYQDYGAVTLNLNWELDFWGKNRAAIAAAASEARAAQAEAAEARLLLTTDIASAYATLGRLRADRAVAAESVRVREDTAALVARRVGNGLDTQAELKQAKASPPATRATVAAIDEQIALTRDALAALVGAGPDRGLSLSPDAPPSVAAFGLPADLRLSLIGRRPDVVAARWRADAASRRVHVATASFYPNVDLTGYFGQQAFHIDQLLSRSAAVGAIGPALDLPIFEGGRLRGELRGARADRDAAVAAYDEAVTQALRDVADVAASERALTERLSQSRKALEYYEGAYKVARLRYEGGLSTFQSVLLAEDAVLTQRQIVSDLDGRAFTLDVALVRALGGGFGPSKDSPHA